MNMLARIALVGTSGPVFLARAAVGALNAGSVRNAAGVLEAEEADRLLLEHRLRHVRGLHPVLWRAAR